MAGTVGLVVCFVSLHTGQLRATSPDKTKPSAQDDFPIPEQVIETDISLRAKIQTHPIATHPWLGGYVLYNWGTQPYRDRHTIPACYDRQFDLNALSGIRKVYDEKARKYIYGREREIEYCKEVKRLNLQRVVLPPNFPHDTFKELDMLDQFLAVRIDVDAEMNAAEIDIALLAEMSNLKTLDLSCCRPTGDFAGLAKLKKLGTLSLPGVTSTTQLETLQKSGLLRQVTNLGLRTTSQSLEFLRDRDNLKSVYLLYNRSPEHDARTIDILKSLENLKCLYLEDIARNRPLDLEPLAELQDIEKLIIRANSIRGLLVLKKMPNLRYIVLIATEEIDGGVKPVAGLDIQGRELTEVFRTGLLWDRTKRNERRREDLGSELH